METKPFEQVMERFRALRIDEPFDMIVAIADGGILPAGILCRKLGLPVYLLRLNLRDECQHKLYDRPKLLRSISTLRASEYSWSKTGSRPERRSVMRRSCSPMRRRSRPSR